MKEKVRNLLIVGRTGCGKSTLANVLSNTDEFEESELSVSKTENSQKQYFELKGMKYCVVDTVGIGNTKLSDRKEKILDKITKGINSMPEGINQVLFVIDGAPGEIKMLKSFEKEILEFAKYITIVRTKFDNFKNEGDCKKDKSQLCEESKTIAKIVKCRDIIYVNNPSINILAGDDDGGGDAEKRIRINKKMRAKSRTILLDHLERVCQGKPYKLTKWDTLRAKGLSSCFKKPVHPEHLVKS